MAADSANLRGADERAPAQPAYPAEGPRAQTTSGAGGDRPTSGGPGQGKAAPPPPAESPAPPPPPRLSEHRIWLSLVELPGGKPVQVDILRACPAEWSHGSLLEVPVGLSIETDPRTGAFALQRLTVTHKSIELVPVDDLDLLVLRLFVATNEQLVRGVAFLPDGARLTIETICDVTTVTGRGSFYITAGRA